jgi:hypothetical protein
MLTNIIIALCSLVFGAGCLGVGYLLGKKKKIEAMVQAEIDRRRAQFESLAGIAKGTIEGIKKI